MHAHYLLVDESDQWHIVEAIKEGLPELDVVPPLDLIKKAVNSCNGLTLVIATEDDNLVGESTLEREKKADDFAALLASINVVAHEQVLSIWRQDRISMLLLVLIAHFLKHVQKIGVLAVDISKYLNWSFKLDESLLLFELLGDLSNQKLDHLDRQVDVRDGLGILLSIGNYVIVEVIYYNIHDEATLILEIPFGYARYSFLELSAPLLLYVQCF